MQFYSKFYELSSFSKTDNIIKSVCFLCNELSRCPLYNYIITYHEKTNIKTKFVVNKLNHTFHKSYVHNQKF